MVNAISDYLDGFQYLSTSTNRGNGGGTELLLKSQEMSKAMEIQAYALNGTILPIDPGIHPPIGGGIAETLKDSNLSFFSTAEGYYYYKKDQYIYQYKDHLGNVRLSFGRNSTGALEITDANDYYPFGMNHLKTGTAFFGQSTYKNYKYNGKELQETGMYDYGARMYMPDLARWGVVDPLAETSRRWNPYTYAYDNPMMFIDPDGREAERCCSWNQIKSFAGGFARGAGNAVTGIVSTGVKYNPVTMGYAGMYDTYQAGKRVYGSYQAGGAKAAAREAGNIAYETTGAKTIVETGKGVLNGNPEAIGAAVVMIGAAKGLSKAGGVKSNSKVMGDLTKTEMGQIQAEVNNAGRPLEVVGSAAEGTRRNVGSNLPVGKGEGTRSDIDYISPPSSIQYFEQNKLPSIDPNTGIIPGYGNEHIGPVLRFEPGELSAPTKNRNLSPLVAPALNNEEHN